MANIFSLQLGLVPWMFLNIYNFSAKVGMMFECMTLISWCMLLPTHEKTYYFGEASHSSTGSRFDKDLFGVAEGWVYEA